MKEIILKIRKIIPVIASILWIGAILMPIAGRDNQLIEALFLSSYVLLIACSLLARKFLFIVVFLFMAALIPSFELMFLTNYSIHTREFFVNGDNHGFFSLFGNAGEVFFSIIVPVIIFIFKGVHILFQLMSKND
jgi:hypothetical protein